MALPALALAACVGQDDVVREDDGENRAVIEGPDGAVTIWGGRAVAKRIAEGKLACERGTTDAWSRVDLGRALVEEAAGRPRKLVTLSMEEMRGDVALSLCTNALARDPRDFELLVFRPGDPFLTGHLQIMSEWNGGPAFGYSVTRWVRSQIGSWAEQIWATGLLDDPDRPSLKYDGNPRTWPPLPEHWK